VLWGRCVRSASTPSATAVLRRPARTGVWTRALPAAASWSITAGTRSICSSPWPRNAGRASLTSCTAPPRCAPRGRHWPRFVAAPARHGRTGPAGLDRRARECAGTAQSLESCPGVVVDRKTGERYIDERYESVLVSTNTILSVAEKDRLRLAYDAVAVDMEAVTVARLARAHGLAFHAIKAISDTADFDMSGLSEFATEDGQFRERAFALHTALRPWTWGKLTGLAKNSAKAIQALNEALRTELDL